jgi:hypothetical protein
MRFKVKPKPCFWDKKTVIKFAWYPIRVNDLIVWWEMYESTYIYRKDWFYIYYWELYERKVFDK